MVEVFQGGAIATAIAPGRAFRRRGRLLGYSPMVLLLLLLPSFPLYLSPLFLIGHFHKTSHAIASRREFDYDEPFVRPRVRGFSFFVSFKKNFFF